MKHFLIIIASLFLLFSCKEKEERIIEGYFYDFIPRQSNYIWITPCQYRYVGQSIYQYEELKSLVGVKDNNFYTLPVRFKDFALSLKTCNVNSVSGSGSNYKGNLDTLFYLSYNFTESSIPFDVSRRDAALESAMQQDYDKYIKSRATKANKISIEYRVTDVKDLKIYALDKKIFNRVPKTPITDLFKIVRFDAPFIISSVTGELLYGYNSASYPNNIEEWLSLSPKAQPNMLITFKETLSEIPLDNIRFVIEMECTDGTILRDTTGFINIF